MQSDEDLQDHFDDLAGCKLESYAVGDGHFIIDEFVLMENDEIF